jgi:arginase
MHEPSHVNSSSAAPIRIVGAPMDLGAARRGVDMGPFAVRYAELRERLADLGHPVEDAGNVPVPFREDAERGAQRGARYLGAITDVCRDLAVRTRDAVEAGARPLVLGGDHAIAAGSVAGAAAALRARGQSLGLIWLDAHADCNTPASSKSGNVHGMPVAHLLGHGDRALAHVGGAAPAVHARHVVLVGVRDVDRPEREHLAKWGVRAFTMRDLDERGVRAVMQEAIAIASDGTSGLWVSCDVDWLDPADAPGVGTPVAGGATYREAHLAMEMLADTGRVVGLDLVEVNPVLDHRNRTAELAVGLALSCFGQRIL